jgi:tRNA(Ile)-lysidine synthase
MDFIKKLKFGLVKISPFKKAVVAVSAGADSVVLAFALKKLGYEIVIAHLNHQLRGEESDGDEEFVKNMAKDLGVKCEVKKVNIEKTGNLENNARAVRYDFLEEARIKHKADFIAVAHHLDDQIETVLMHMARGAGLRGQRGMEYQSDTIIRPFLGIKRQEILNYASEQGLKYRTDSSNGDLSYDRNFWRHLVIPYLKNQMPGLGIKIQKISEQANKKLTVISKKAGDWVSKYFTDNQFGRDKFNNLSDEIKSEILIRILGANDLYAKDLNALSDFIKTSQSGRRMKVKDLTFFIEHGNVIIGEEMRKKDLPKAKITVEGIKWGEWKIKSADSLNLYVRQWKQGDRFVPSGMSGHKKLQDFFTDKKIPRHLRNQIPIIVNGKGDIIAVGNLRRSDVGKNFKFEVNLKT